MCAGGFVRSLSRLGDFNAQEFAKPGGGRDGIEEEDFNTQELASSMGVSQVTKAAERRNEGNFNAQGINSGLGVSDGFANQSSGVASGSIAMQAKVA